MKICPFCKAELPDESIYCLNCASVLNERQVFPAVKEKKKKKSIVFFPRKKVMGAVAVLLSFAIVISSCIFALYSSNEDTPKTEEKKTTLVPVTEENGESVTDDNGEQVFEVTEVTETNTEKQGLLEKLFGKDEDKNSDKNNNSESTTKKQSLIDKIFGNGEEDEEESSSSTSTTEPEATTSAEPSAETTTGKAENSSTSTTKSTTESTTQEDTTSCINDFEYTELNGKIKITKYTGNASTVTVPAYIDGKHVSYLGENAFANNSNIKKIVFTGTTSGTNMFYLPTARTVFNNLPNLTSITFPYETHYRMVNDTETSGNYTFYELLVDCPKVSGIYFTSKVNSDYSSTLKTMYSTDGVICAQTSGDKMYGQPYRDSNLLYYPPAKTDAQYTIPIRINQIEKYAFKNNPYIKSIHFSEANRYVKANFIGCINLQQFTVDENNTTLFAENGVLYTGSASVNDVSYRAMHYPPGKKDVFFEFSEKCNIRIDGYTFCGNPYIETIKCPKTTSIEYNLINGEGKPTALSTIMLKEENSNTIATYKDSFNYVYY